MERDAFAFTPVDLFVRFQVRSLFSFRRLASRRSCRPVLEENLFDIRKSEFPCPGQGSRPRFVIGQVGRGTALEQELDHPSPALGQLGLFAAEPGTNGGGQRRLVEFEASGVDVGAGVQKDCRDGPVSASRRRRAETSCRASPAGWGRVPEPAA